MGEVKVTVEGDEVVIRMPIDKKPSASGKTTVVGSTRGNFKSGVQVDGRELYATATAFYYPEDKK